MGVRVTVLYFASLRDAAGMTQESLETEAVDLRSVYESAQARHGFALGADRMRVAVDGAFAQWSDAPREGAEVAFIPPVSGG